MAHAMVHAIGALPPSLDLGCIVEGNGQPIQRSFTLRNYSEVKVNAVIEPDNSLRATASSIRFEALADKESNTTDANSSLTDYGSAAEDGYAGAPQEENENLLYSCFAADHGDSGDDPYTISVDPEASIDIRMIFFPSEDLCSTTDALSSLDGSAETTQPGRFPIEQFQGLLRVSCEPSDSTTSTVKDEGNDSVLRETEILVRGSACISRIRLDETKLHFGECAPGGRYVKDFCVRNLSELDTRFRLSCADDFVAAMLEFTDYETGDRVDHARLPLPSNGQFQIQVILHIPEDGVSAQHGDIWFCVENVLDPRNFKYVKVELLTAAASPSKGVEASEERLAFGECYALRATSKRLSLRNTDQEPLTATIGSTLRNEVAFEVISTAAEQGLTSPRFDQSGQGSWQSGPAVGNDSERNQLRDASQLSEGGTGVPGTHNQRARDASRNATKSFVPSEKIDFSPGQTRHLRVWYTPSLEPSTDDIHEIESGRLVERKFHLTLHQHGRDVCYIPVTASVCESMVRLGSSEIDLGDCDVLNTYRASVTVFNVSDMEAPIEIDCESKSLTPSHRKVTVPPRQAFDVTFTFIPRKLNPDYTKEVRFLNLANPERNVPVVSFRSNNVDERGVSLHAVFYKLLDPAPTNEIAFGRTWANYPAIRMFRVRNVSEEVLVLGLECPPGVATFVQPKNLKKLSVRTSASSASGICELEPNEEHGELSSGTPPRSSSPNTLRASSDLRPLATTAESAQDVWVAEGSVISTTVQALIDADDAHRLAEGFARANAASHEVEAPQDPQIRNTATAKLSLAAFIASLPEELAADGIALDAMRRRVHSPSAVTQPPPTEAQIQSWLEQDFQPLTLNSRVFSGMDDEIQCALQQLRPGSALFSALQHRQLVRANHISLGPNEESVVAVAWTPGDDSVQRRAVESTLRVRLLQYDEARLANRIKASSWRGTLFSETDTSNLPLREVVMSVHACQSMIRVRPMQNLNFGTMIAGTQKHRNFTIENSKSNACLVFLLRKSGSVASDDVRLGNGFDTGRLGIVRPFSSISIPFLFRPSFPGMFDEAIEIVNMADGAANEHIRIKAHVEKKSNFHISAHSSGDFGCVDCGVPSPHVLAFDLHNDSSAPRRFSVSAFDRSRSSVDLPTPSILIKLLPQESELEEPLFPGAEDSEAYVEIRAKEAKLKIYELKGKAAKAGVLKKEIEELKKNARKEMDLAAAQTRISEGSTEKPGEKGSETVATPEQSTLKFEEEAVFELPGKCKRPVEVRLLAKSRKKILERAADNETWTQALQQSDALLRSERPLVGRNGNPIAGTFRFTLRTCERKDRDRSHMIPCFAEIAPWMSRSDSSSSNSELIVPADDEALDAARPSSPFGPHALVSPDGPARSSDQHLSATGPCPTVDFGMIRAGVRHRRPIQLRSVSNKEIQYDAVSASAGSDPEQFVSLLGTPTADTNRGSIVQVTGLETPIRPGETKTFYVELILLQRGVYSHRLALVPVSHTDGVEQHDVMLLAACTGGEAAQLSLAEADDAADGPDTHQPSALVRRSRPGKQESTIDLGIGVVDSSKEYALVRKILVKSVVDIATEFAISSNLTSQVLVFVDEELTTPAASVSLPAKGTKSAWIALAPRLRPEDVRDGSARDLVGGLQLVVHFGVGMVISESSIRFCAIVGSSCLLMEPPLVDLGIVEPTIANPEYSIGGLVSLQNSSSTIPAKFRVETSPEVVLSKPGDNPTDSQTLMPGDSLPIPFSMTCKASGVTWGWIKARNLLSPTMSVVSVMRGFADSKLLTAKVCPNGAHDASMPHPIAFVAESGAGGWSVSSGGNCSIDLGLRPGASRPLAVVPCVSRTVPSGEATSSAPCDSGPSSDGAKSVMNSYRDELVPIGPCVELSSESPKAVVEVSIATSDTMEFSAVEVEGIECGSLVSKTFRVAFVEATDEDFAEGRVEATKSTLLELAIPCTICKPVLSFGLPQAVEEGDNAPAGIASEPSSDRRMIKTTLDQGGRLCRTDLGRLGHCTAWHMEEVSVLVHNPTEVRLFLSRGPMRDGFAAFRGDCGTPGTADAEEILEDTWIAVEPQRFVKIVLQVSPAQVADALRGVTGPMSCTIELRNRMSPALGLTWDVRGLLAGSRLRFDGVQVSNITQSAENSSLDNGSDSGGSVLYRSSQRRTVCLPDLKIPGSRVCSRSFTITNVSEDKVWLEFATNEAPDCEQRVGGRIRELVDVHYTEHVSGVELKEVSLSPKDSVTIRLSVAPQSTSQEQSLVREIFGNKDAIQGVVSELHIRCASLETVEPTETVTAEIQCKRRSSFEVSPLTLSFDSVDHLPRGTSEAAGEDDPDRGLLICGGQVLRLSNLWRHSTASYFVRVSNLPQNIVPNISPQRGSVAPGSSVELQVAFARHGAERGHAFGNATILIFEGSVEETNGSLGTSRPCLSVPVQLTTMQDHAPGDDLGGPADSSAPDAPHVEVDRSSRTPGGRASEHGPAADEPGGSRSMSPTVSFRSAPSTSCSPRSSVAADPRERGPLAPVASHNAPGTTPRLPVSMALPPSGFTGPGDFARSHTPPPASLRFALEDARHSVESRMSGDSENASAGASSAFSLRGCSQVPGDPNRFELNCGHFNVSTEPYVRRVIVENLSPSVLEYRCLRIRPRSGSTQTLDSGAQGDEDWFTISRSGGTLEPAGQLGDSQAVVITIRRTRMNVYSTYLVFESSEDVPVKIVRLSAEVVANGQAAGVAESYFTVLCDGRGADDRFIDYSTVFFDQFYRHRSFVVCNKNEETMEFLLSHSLSESSRSELTFSLTNSALRKISRLSLQAGERRRVFLFYRPMLELSDPIDFEGEICRDFFVRVSCRLVRDYQASIKVTSRCRHPNLAITKSDFLFDCGPLVRATIAGTVSSMQPVAAEGPDTATFAAGVVGEPYPPACESPSSQSNTPKNRSPTSSHPPDPRPEAGLEETDSFSPTSPHVAILVVKNRHKSRAVSYAVRNSSRYFEIENGGPDTIACDEGNNHAMVVLRPNLKRIRERAHTLHRERYVEEHVSVYNRDCPREFFWIRIRLAIGGAANDFSAASHRRAFAFSAIEATVARFLSQFSSFWSQFRLDGFIPSGKHDAEADARDGVVDERSTATDETVRGRRLLDLWASHVAEAPTYDGYNDVLFEVHYATDELVHYMLRSATQSGLQLASLLYSYIFGHDAFATFLEPEGQHLSVPPMLMSWVGQLGHFLSFFPDKMDEFRGLCELEERFRARLQ